MCHLGRVHLRPHEVWNASHLLGRNQLTFILLTIGRKNQCVLHRLVVAVCNADATRGWHDCLIVSGKRACHQFGRLLMPDALLTTYRGCHLIVVDVSFGVNLLLILHCILTSFSRWLTVVILLHNLRGMDRRVRELESMIVNCPSSIPHSLARHARREHTWLLGHRLSQWMLSQLFYFFKFILK